MFVVNIWFLTSLSSFGAVEFKVVAPMMAPLNLFAQPRRLLRPRRESIGLVKVVCQPFASVHASPKAPRRVVVTGRGGDEQVSRSVVSGHWHCYAVRSAHPRIGSAK